MNRLLHITGDMTMADTIVRNEKLLPVIRRFGIELGFKEKSIKTLAEENGINLELLLLVLNMFDDNSIYISNISNTSIIPELIQYLKQGHNYYIKEKLPYINTLIEKFVSESSNHHSTLLLRFFEEYKTEVIEHMAYEDSDVYPYIIDRYNASLDKSNTFSIDEFSEHHSDIEEKLYELKMLLIKHFPPTTEGGFYRNMILLELFNLEYDLNDHTVLENRVLVPLVKIIEKKQLGEQ